MLLQALHLSCLILRLEIPIVCRFRGPNYCENFTAPRAPPTMLKEVYVAFSIVGGARGAVNFSQLFFTA